MTVFKTVLKIVKKYKFTIILYTVLLILFAGFNFQTNETKSNFIATRPDILIVNNDENKGITKDLIDYLKNNTNVIDSYNDESEIEDALFYREINYIIYIPKNFRTDLMNGLNPEVKIKKTNNYESELAEVLLNKYLKMANIYQKGTNDEEAIISKINKTLSSKTKVEINSKLDTNKLSKATFYFNFLNYSILAGCVYVICLILASFREQNINKRNLISSKSYKKLNFNLLLSNSLIALILWACYIILSFILLGSTMMSIHGIMYIINSFVFTICALSIAFLIGNIVRNKTAINGIINVVALGSSFLCGSFVPMEYLPDSVIKLAHILPSYWFIKNNELIKTIEKASISNLRSYLLNLVVVLVFVIIFVVISNIISKRKQKII